METSNKEHIGRDWLDKDQDDKPKVEEKKLDKTNDDYVMDTADAAALNITQIETLDADGNQMGGFQYTKKKGNFYQCRVCKVYSISQNDEKMCINPDCGSNNVSPSQPGQASCQSVIDMGKMLGKKPSKEKKVTVKGKEFEKGKIPSFETHKFSTIHQLLVKAQEQKRFLFIADLTGKVGTALQYSTCQFFDLHGEHKKYYIAKKQTIQESVEAVRRFFVNTMQGGSPLIINMDTMIVPLRKEYETPMTPLKDLLLNPTNFWMPHQEYKKILMEDEDKDMNGNVGLYCLNPKFSVSVLQDASDIDCDDEIVQMLMDEIENIDDFWKVYIEAD